MEEKHLRTLEFPQVLNRLAQHTTFSAGRTLALALRPSPVYVEVEQSQRETGEARFLLDTVGGLPLGGAHDVRNLASNAQRGAVLQPTDLLDIRSTLRAGARVQRALERLHEQVPLLADIAGRIEPCTRLAEEIDQSISDQGEVIDDASPTLARIRREMRTAHDRLLDRLNNMVASSRYGTFLQEALVTQRGGRYVIPIKAEFKGRIPGIVHDTSASGATIFIEPLAVVDLGNRWRELQIEEQKEVERILAALSAQVATNADELIWTVEALAELDVIVARGRYANAIDATAPTMVPYRSRYDTATLDLRQARHPVLDPDLVVPIDVYLREGIRALVITGPNTGGKTVSLKTVGLMAAMAQSGLHLPVADGSEMSVFEGLYADIGDEQSIEQSLSTFSSHLTNIITILEEVNERCLVLLDELGAGTDPVEGSALARAILTHLLGRQVTTLVATHYSELKMYAQTTPGVENASVEFDIQTLSPTYRMQIGLPGRSNAFAIAERLGLPHGIVQAARALVSPEELEADTLLGEIQEAHRETAAARDEALLTRREVAEQEHRLAVRLAAIDAERASILGEARAEARRLLDETRDQIEVLRSEMEGQKDMASLGEEWLAQARARLAEQEKAIRTERASRPSAEGEFEDAALPGEVEVGDSVWVRGLNMTGQVTGIEGNTIEIQVGRFGVRVEKDELERRSRRQAKAEEREALVIETGVTVSAQPRARVEIDLRGQRVEEVVPRLDKYLDDAFLAGMPFVRIVHGKGTGALRQAVREQLRKHPLVKSQRPGAEGEGGSGVTVAYLTES
ncbi:MAG: endonuclease MutS2 [Anaerolineae bacterium]|nr:endonuclease MutS2 [Anaerolineae bacterium]